MNTKKREAQQITLERTWQAQLSDVWELWTTKEGLEAWWGPDGFSVKVQKLDLRPGGELRYSMSAVAPPQIEFMKKHGMPLTTHSIVTYREIVPEARLAYDHLADFIPGVEAYWTGMVVEMQQTAQGVKLRLTLDAMHDEVWTQRMVMGWEMELGKLAKLLAARK